jgi:hypothetical protein
MDVCKTAGMGLPLPVQIPTDSESWSIERIAMVGTVTMLLSVHSEAPWDSGPCVSWPGRKSKMEKLREQDGPTLGLAGKSETGAGCNVATGKQPCVRN